MFIIPVIISMQGYEFEIYTTVCDMHEGLDLVFGMQNMVETEGEMTARDGCFRFMSRSIPIFPRHPITVPPGGKAHLSVTLRAFQRSFSTLGFRSCVPLVADRSNALNSYWQDPSR